MAEPRWDDTSYGARIFISQIVGVHWDSETGFGITSGVESECPFEESYDAVTIDFTTKLVTYGSFTFGFSEFISLNEFASV